MDKDRFRIIFDELENSKKLDEFTYKMKPVIRYSDEISELYRLSEELKQPMYQVTSST